MIFLKFHLFVWSCRLLIFYWFVRYLRFCTAILLFQNYYDRRAPRKAMGACEIFRASNIKRSSQGFAPSSYEVVRIYILFVEHYFFTQGCSVRLAGEHGLVSAGGGGDELVRAGAHDLHTRAGRTRCPPRRSGRQSARLCAQSHRRRLWWVFDCISFDCLFFVNFWCRKAFLWEN